MEILWFWLLGISLFLLFYTFFGYGILMWILSKIFPREIKKDESFEPTISVILPVYNDEKYIREKLENLLSLDYPASKIEYIIGSDSNDGTNEILREYMDHPQIHLDFSQERRGKIGAINAIVPKAKNEILLFTDAHELFEKDALRKLVRNFADPEVGGVTGLHQFRQKDSTVAQGTSLYWKYERMIQKWESKVWSLQSADGCIYAIRKELFIPPPNNMALDDDLIPLLVALQGYRIILEEEARAYSDPFVQIESELSRRITFQMGHFQNLSFLWKKLIPFVSPIGFGYFSHKTLRTLTGFLLIIALISNIMLLSYFPFQFLLLAQGIFYGFGLMGLLGQKLGFSFFLFSLPLYFLLHGYATIVGFGKFLKWLSTSGPYKGWEKKDPGA
ncbi:MAG: glycosyltransferase family 2 protein [Planctomycetota bacterium]|nr:MAG: glycosyltransferase family 2 protein [Planctomycetota bacterium]